MSQKPSMSNQKCFIYVCTKNSTRWTKKKAITLSTVTETNCRFNCLIRKFFLFYKMLTSTKTADFSGMMFSSFFSDDALSLIFQWKGEKNTKLKKIFFPSSAASFFTQVQKGSWWTFLMNYFFLLLLVFSFMTRMCLLVFKMWFQHYWKWNVNHPQ